MPHGNQKLKGPATLKMVYMEVSLWDDVKRLQKYYGVDSNSAAIREAIRQALENCK